MAYKVAQINPALADTNEDLYTVPSGSEAVVSTFSICESAGTAATYRILIRPAGATESAAHRFVYDSTVNPNETVLVTAGAALGSGDVVTVQSSTTDVTFMAFVSEL